MTMTSITIGPGDLLRSPPINDAPAFFRALWIPLFNSSITVLESSSGIAKDTSTPNGLEAMAARSLIATITALKPISSRLIQLRRKWIFSIDKSVLIAVFSFLNTAPSSPGPSRIRESIFSAPLRILAIKSDSVFSFSGFSPCAKSAPAKPVSRSPMPAAARSELPMLSKRAVPFGGTTIDGSPFNKTVAPVASAKLLVTPNRSESIS